MKSRRHVHDLILFELTESERGPAGSLRLPRYAVGRSEDVLLEAFARYGRAVRWAQENATALPEDAQFTCPQCHCSNFVQHGGPHTCWSCGKRVETRINPDLRYFVEVIPSRP